MKLARVLVLALLVASLAAAYVGWQKVGALRAENEALRAENQALKEQGAASAETQSKQHDQELQRLQAETQEIQKLRNEVSQLRAGAKETEKLRAENQQLRTAANSNAVTASVSPGTPTPTGPSDQFPKQSWAFAGYSTPEAALVSAIWSMREGNPKTYLDSLSPEEQVRMAKTWENKSEAEIAAKHQQDVASITGMRILDRQTVSPNEVMMNVYVEGPGRMEKVSMKLVGNEWKFGGFIRK
jgi:hypothetical protein